MPQTPVPIGAGVLYRGRVPEGPPSGTYRRVWRPLDSTNRGEGRVPLAATGRKVGMRLRSELRSSPPITAGQLWHPTLQNIVQCVLPKEFGTREAASGISGSGTRRRGCGDASKMRAPLDINGPSAPDKSSHLLPVPPSSPALLHAGVMVGFTHRLNAVVADSFVGRHFRLEGSGHPKEREGSRFLTEIRAGVTTWAAMAYIISVNAAILRDSGGTCVCSTNDGCTDDAVYLSCVADVQRDLITTTASISALSSFLMGLLANLPVGMAPGLGLNAYFTYSVVGFHGSGFISYREALAAVFMEGWIFFILSLLGLRQWLARIMPQSLVMAVGAGIGLFIAFIGLSTGGLGVIGGDTTNFVGLGGCLAEDYLSADLPNYCGTRVLRNPTVWLGIFTGGILTVLLMLYRIKAAILIGIFVTSIISWPRSTAVSYFPHTDAGDAMFDFFKQVVTFWPLQRVGNALDYNYGNGKVWYALITFLYVDILDTTGTLYSMAKFAGLRDPVTLDFENSTIAYCVDAFSISMGALMGTSPVTAFVESATGISEGGKTGITAMITGVMFFVSIFFAPIFASIPPWATGGALVIVGSLMIRNVREINWDYVGDAVPAFLTIIMIPLTYNIAYGVIAGVFSYVLINGTAWLVSKISGGRIVPPNYAASEAWVIPPGGVVPTWMKVVAGRRSSPINPSTDVPLQPRRSPSIDERSHTKASMTEYDMRATSR